MKNQRIARKRHKQAILERYPEWRKVSYRKLKLRVFGETVRAFCSPRNIIDGVNSLEESKSILASFERIEEMFNLDKGHLKE